jgi:hypothetical protein
MRKWFGFVAVMAWASVAGAHTYPTERAMMVQVGSARADVMITYREPAGERARLLMTRLDFNRSGALEETEQALAESVMGGLMLRGVQLEVVGERPGVMAPSFKVRVAEDGAIEAAALVSYTLEPLEQDKRRVFTVRVLEESGVVPTSVVFQGIEGETRLVGVAAPNRQLKLGAGQQASAQIAREEPAPPAAAPVDKKKKRAKKKE